MQRTKTDLLKLKQDFNEEIESFQYLLSQNISNDLKNVVTDNLAVINAYIETINRSIELVDQKISLIKDTMNFSSAMESIGQMGNSISQIFKAAGNDVKAWAIASLGQIAELIAQLGNMAVVAGVSSAAKLPFPYNLAAIAASVATISTIVSGAMQTFTNGGIVNGGSYSGDKTTIRVNAGEMVLNRSQQANLFRIIEGGNSNNSALSGDVSFRIQGKDLVGVLNNYNNKMSKLR